MAVIGATTFGFVVWGAAAGVLLVFLYQMYAIAKDIT